MKHPKIFFEDSFCIQELVLSTNYDKKLKNFINKFEKFFRKYEQTILELIKKYTGFGWKEKEITIWLFNSNLDSIPDPVLVSVKNYNKYVVLFETVRMLALRILLFNDIYSYYERCSKAIDKVEVYSYLIGKEVIKDILGDNILKKIYNSLADDFNLYLWEDCKRLEEKIDLNKLTIKKSLKKNIML